MNRSSFPLPAVAIAILAAGFAVPIAAQDAAGSPGPPPGGPPPHHDMPAPTNLKVLPKNMTGEQVHTLMHEWAGNLGVRCNTCHAADPTKKGPDGKPLLNYADDSREEKRTARIMYQMLEDINVKYVSKVPNSDMPVTCGTCHRGKLDPDPYVIPKPALHAH
ncbi:MAG: c-type cytochrome [Terracidiphilus sp.]